MVPYGIEEGKSMKHSLKQVGRKYVFTIKNLSPEDAGLYSVDVEGVNVFSTAFKGMFLLRIANRLVRRNAKASH